LRDAAHRRERALRPGNPDPWSASTAQYRANVLAFLQDLAAKGAHPVLLINKSPYAGSSDAVAWWRSVAKVADIVREVYLPATNIWPLGPVLGNRYVRQSYRNAIADLTSLGIPANRVGLMLSFLSHRGVGGRNGLEPASAWYQVVKWETLSVKHVAREVGLGSVFSWGWQMWNRREMDPDKRQAACVWLWARERRLCNAPRRLGKFFDRSLTEGQISLRAAPSAASRVSATSAPVRSAHSGNDRRPRCCVERPVRAGRRGSGTSGVAARGTRGTTRGDPGFLPGQTERLTLRRYDRRTPPLGLRCPRSVTRCRRARLEQSRSAPKPTGSAVAAFYAAYPDLLVRRVHASPAPPWLGRRTGFAVSQSAPQRLFLPANGTEVPPLDPPRHLRRPAAGSPRRPLGSLPLQRCGRGSSQPCAAFERAQSFERWTIRQQTHAVNRTICLHDQLPQPAAIDLTEYCPSSESSRA
jgi:hypothetical protein